MSQNKHKRSHSLAEITTQANPKKRATLPVGQNRTRNDIDGKRSVLPVPTQPDMQTHDKPDPERSFTGPKEHEPNADPTYNPTVSNANADTHVNMTPQDIEVDQTIDSDADVGSLVKALTGLDLERINTLKTIEPKSGRKHRNIRWRGKRGKATGAEQEHEQKEYTDCQ